MAEDDSTARAHRPVRNRRFRRLRIIGGIICLLAILTFVAVHTPPARRFAAQQVVALLAREQIDFSTDELGYNLFGASFNLRNVRIRSTTWPDAPVFATIGRVRINMSLVQLLHGRYVIQSGSAEDVDVHYFVDEQGRDNLPRPPRDPNEPQKKLDYLISSLTVSRAHVRYENRAEKIDAQLPVPSIQVKGNDFTDRHLITLDAAGGDVQMPDRRVAIDRLHGQVDVGEDDASITQLQVESTGSRADVTGTITNFTTPVGDLRLKSSVDTMQVAPLAKVDDPVSGTIEIDATAKGPLSTPAINAHVTGSSLQFRELRDATIDANAAYDLATRRAEVASFTARGPWGGLTGNGNVAVDEAGQSRINADINALDLGTIMRALRSPYITATRVDGNVQASWPGLEFLKASGEANAKLTATSARATKSVMPLSGRVVVRGNGNRLDAQLANVATPGAEINGNVAMTADRRLQGNIKGQAGDVGRLASTVEAFLGRPSGSMLPTTVAGAANVDAQLGGKVDAPTAAATLNAPALTVGKTSGIALNAQTKYQPTAFDIASADVTWKEARAHVDGRVGLDGNRQLNLNVSADHVDVPSVLAALDQTGVPASGIVSATGTVTGTTDRPAARFTAQGSDLVAYEEQIGSFNADLQLNGRDVAVSNFVLEKPQPDGAGKLVASGTYNLDRKTYTADAKSDGIRLVGLVLPNGQRVRGDVQLTAHGEGSVDSPAGTADLTVAKVQVNDASYGDVVVKAVAANNEAKITASSDQFKVDANALVGLMRPWPATIKATVNDFDVKTLPTEVRLKADTTTDPLKPDTTTEAEPNRFSGLEGTVRATIDASGNLSDPESGKATVALDAFDGKWNGRPLKITSPSPLQYADKRLKVEKLQVGVEGGTLNVSGELPLTDQAGEGDIALDLKGNLATISLYTPSDTNVQADGTITMTGSLKGTLKRIDPKITIEVANGLILSPVLEPGFSNIQLKANIADGEARVDQLSGNWGTASIEGSGRIPLEAVPPLPVEIPRMGGPATFKAAVKGLNPASIPGAPSGTTGVISVEADVSAKRADLASLDGTISFDELQLGLRGLVLAQQQVSKVMIAAGKATIDQLQLSGTAGEIKAGGSVGLVADRAIDVNVDGNLNVGAISVLTNKVRAEGDSKLNVHAGGTMSDPQVMGTVDLSNTSFASDQPNVAGENLSAHVDLEGKRIVLSNLKADVNGGTLTGSGSVTLGNGTIADIDMQLKTDDFAYDAPLDLRSISDADLRIARDGDDIVISGQVKIVEGGLTGDFNFDTGLLAAITARPRLDLTEKRDPFVEQLRFNINVNTESPILIDNNLARAEVDTDLRLVGTPYQPGVLGELRLLEGSEVRLNERRYEAQPSAITFVDERRIFPSFDLHLNTTVRSYNITIAITGTPGDTETIFTSDPTLPEPDIMAMLVTGRTLDDMRGEEYEVAREQVLSYLTGRVGSQLGRGLQEATGFSEVRIEPAMIANETNPGARLTVGQEITDQAKLVYSTNLTDSNDQIWVAEYDVTRRFQTEGVRQSDNSYRFDFKHDVRFGGQPEPRRVQRAQPDIEAVDVSSSGGMEETDLREKFRLKAGDKYDFFKIRNGVQRVEDALMKEGYLQSRVRLERRIEGNKAHLTLHVTRGPRVEIQFDGAMPPQKVQDDVRMQWHRGVFDKQRADAGVKVLREWLMGDQYLQPKLEYMLDPGSDTSRRVVFKMQPGMRSEKVVLAFEGASGLDPDVLDKIIAQQKLERKVFTDPMFVTQLLQRYYHDQGFLVAEIDEPKYEFPGTVARVVFAVREGPAFRVRHVTAKGANVIEADRLIPQLPVVSGEPFLPVAAENSLDKIRDLYWKRGYNDVRSDYSLVLDRAQGQVDIAFTVREGRQSVIADVKIAGNSRVSDHLVREQIQLKPGEPLDLSLLARSRRNLYDTGAFSVVDIQRHDEAQGLAQKPDAAAAQKPDAPPQNASSTPAQKPEATPAEHSDSTPTPDTPDQQRPVEVNVNIREVQPFQIRYGASYDTERGVGGIFDISTKNWMGGARELGLRSRYDRQLHEGRLYLNQPALKYLPKTTGAIYFREELNPPTELTDPFDTSRKGVSVESEQRLRDRYVFSYGYRYERVHTLTPQPGGIILNEALTVAPLTGTLTRETRDEALDATKGTFLSHAFSFSPSWLGSDQPFIKYLGQYFKYFALEPVKRKPFTNEMLRPRFVYATGVRLGLSRGFGELVPKSERFFAGGSATLRGFGQNTVGPISPDRIPLGGEAMLVLNNEIRVPLYWIIDGVGFVDLGNVFPRIRDFSFTDIRKSTGVGLRLRTPWVLLRGDYGFVLDPRPGEPRGRFYFSIGQAF